MEQPTGGGLMTVQRGGGRLFTVEMQKRDRALLRGAVAGADKDAGAGAGAESTPALLAVLDELRALRADVADLKGSASVAAPSAPEKAPPPVEGPHGDTKSAMTDREKGEAMRAELREVSEAIDRTKSEIAALRRKSYGDDRLETAAFELDAVVSATEEATDTILGCAEHIEELAGQIVSHDKDGFGARIAEDLSEQVRQIFEACNFQDITGQRINKVVGALKYVEERVSTMIRIWGEETIADAETEDAEATAKQEDEYDRFLHGPQGKDDGDTVSQADIDALFD